MKADANVPGTEIDFVTGSSEASNIVMGEVKTGNNAFSPSKFLDHAENKFQFAKDIHAARMEFLIEADTITDNMKTKAKEKVDQIGFIDFDPKRDLKRLKDVIDVSQCK